MLGTELELTMNDQKSIPKAIMSNMLGLQMASQLNRV